MQPFCNRGNLRLERRPFARDYAAPVPWPDEEGEQQMSTVINAGESAGGVDVDGIQVIEEIREHLATRAEAQDDALDADQHTAPTVLIVDDDGAARLALCGLLWSEGYRIAFSTSADDARERLADIAPDVILCDLIMQGTNGDEFCAWLKAHSVWRYVPVIAVTGVNNTIATAAMLEAGADDVIIKPVKARELQARVGAALRTRERYVALGCTADREVSAARDSIVVREAAPSRQPCIVRDAVIARAAVTARAADSTHAAALG
jgi:DNA-binding response OmpR family regulator